MNKPESYNAPIYPAYTFKESRTYFDWVKITVADLHGLRSEPGFEGQNLYFHVNHPIRFVALVGPIVSIDSVSTKFAFFTLDDGSGATIDVVILRRVPELMTPVDCSSTTDIPNLSITVGLGVFELKAFETKLDIGTVVKVKGVISEYKGTKQLELKRLGLVRSTAEEAKAWKEVAHWKSNILSQPWLLTAEKVAELKRQAVQERRNRLESDLNKQERANLRAERRKRRDEKGEKKRRIQETLMNTGALL